MGVASRRDLDARLGPAWMFSVGDSERERGRGTGSQKEGKMEGRRKGREKIKG